MNEIPDESGLSSDSLRGSVHLIRVDLIGADPQARIDPNTGRGLTRGPLTANEKLALHTAGYLVDENGQPLEGEDLNTVPSAFRPIPQPQPMQTFGIPGMTPVAPNTGGPVTPVPNTRANPLVNMSTADAVDDRLTEAQWRAKYDRQNAPAGVTTAPLAESAPIRPFGSPPVGSATDVPNVTESINPADAPGTPEYWAAHPEQYPGVPTGSAPYDPAANKSDDQTPPRSDISHVE